MQAVGASVHIFELLDRTPGPVQRPLVTPGAQPSPLTATIVFDDVHFTYPSRPEAAVLRGVSFEVPAGSVVALVGASGTQQRISTSTWLTEAAGGGKSTTISLLERFYDPSRGVISIGGHDLRTFDTDWLRDRMALVGQEPVLFACSIKDNIRCATWHDMACGTETVQVWQAWGHG